MIRSCKQLRLSFLIALMVLTAIVCEPPPVASQSTRPLSRLALIEQQYAEQTHAHADALVELADHVEKVGNSAEADALRNRAIAIESQTIHVDDLPTQVQPDLPQDLPADNLQWRSQLRKLQSDHAKQLYLLSRRALREGSARLALQLAREVAWHDPDYPPARKLLGYVRYEDEWTTPFVAAKKRAGEVWDDRFGWLERTHQRRYQNGERYFKGQWMSAQKEAALRSDFRNAWVILSEHYEIHTNHSLEKGVALSLALEAFHKEFMQTFAAFFRTRQQLEKLFDAGDADDAGSGQRYELHYYATRDEYIQRLQSKSPQVAGSNGFYYPKDRTSYFYHNPEDDTAALGTMFHEVTHQLMFESHRRQRQIGEHAHFWIVEGIACHMESFRYDPATGETSIGDPNHARIYFARQRLFDEDYYIPLERFAVMGSAEFQNMRDYKEIQRRYSQATGLAHFFMNVDNGTYRDALIEHLSQIYSPSPRVRGRAEGLDTLTGVPYETLDAQYRDYMQAMDEQHPRATATQ